ncbi:fumarate hydratase [candidate division WOR-1 bacterium RIFOXYA12_FULL_52_29]|uniref:Fumarate hydratase n=1 Tax=candidate division WOR-1 bacterium RIFOXYC12_FULL_54_18 TaxID=1802584 RepID=A0A1F4T7X1_UNCSA|nr:MAG: fumarate hydratase [candidate division WOR-1 bacterium RIFOXYA2_FULL_51_19]OGC18182.1 MAG: fumarate hydratase [candidate division WOR-1 bacterium RIFOXYA12_FULL_52_29]OGC27037.1 MAG: fumarate hydratase [candidate division WOR-1 bacterium RIFOXYB2_FULL_45_9]OGC28599.1 MAG: fumarate hydratase [candidate division WOR-1 bacterium RIFOXYC12_FULL_54_18]OGC30946.1 MAG: fumarate hydratase [candidate division WOR-1 bacterium RIFOXYB12_FULL_52_16]
MRELSTKKITEAVRGLCIEANTNLSADVEVALNKALKDEESPNGREILRQLIHNAGIARKEKRPICQDTGSVVVFIELGQEIRLVDGSLEEAVNEGVSRGYTEGYLRKSIVSDPLRRQNTGDNAPAFTHVRLVPGDKLTINLMCKGGGAENCSAINFFKPTSSHDEISQFIIKTVELAGPNACPPVIVGVGIGGNFELAPLTAKKALLREIGHYNSDHDLAKWEKELLVKINRLGIGPMGLGGRATALAVNIETAPCHISQLPVAVNIECHAHRARKVEL